MNIERTSRVTSQDGINGTVIDTGLHPDGGQAYALIDFGNAMRVMLPTSLLTAKSDGSYYAPVVQEEFALYAERTANTAEHYVLPIIAETLLVEKQLVETGRVRIRKVVREDETIVDEPLLHEEVHVERVAVGTYLDTPALVRNEGDTLIIPLMEEVLVVEKRLLLREELHVHLKRNTVHQPQTVMLKREDVMIERTSTTDDTVAT